MVHQRAARPSRYYRADALDHSSGGEGEMSDLIDYGMSGIAILTLLIALVLIAVIWSAALGSPVF